MQTDVDMLPCEISVIILTLDEAINIGQCIESVSWSNDVVVLDSGSSDATTRIASEHGARIYHRPFDNWSAHQNWAVENIEFRHSWVFYLDADERCTRLLFEEMTSRVRTDNSYSAFRLRRKDYYMGRWLRRAQLYPTWIVRLFRPKLIRYERLVNPVAIVDGPVGELREHLIHYPFSHGVSHWIARHNRYSDLEARELLKIRDGGRPDGSPGYFSADPNDRRRALKDLFFRLPARPVIKFCYCYLWRCGFLDGRPGLSYSVLQAIYEYLIDCKYRELRRQQRGLPI